MTVAGVLSMGLAHSPIALQACLCMRRKQSGNAQTRACLLLHTLSTRQQKTPCRRATRPNPKPPNPRVAPHLQLPGQLLQQAPVLCELPAEAVQLGLAG